MPFFIFHYYAPDPYFCKLLQVTAAAGKDLSPPQQAPYVWGAIAGLYEVQLEDVIALVDSGVLQFNDIDKEKLNQQNPQQAARQTQIEADRALGLYSKEDETTYTATEWEAQLALYRTFLGL